MLIAPRSNFAWCRLETTARWPTSPNVEQLLENFLSGLQRAVYRTENRFD